MNAYQVGEYKKIRLMDMREELGKLVHQQEQLAGAVVVCRLLGKGHTLDDEVTGRRWTFNKYGELVAGRSKRGVAAHSTHPWQPGLRDRVDVA